MAHQTQILCFEVQHWQRSSSSPLRNWSAKRSKSCSLAALDDGRSYLARPLNVAVHAMVRRLARRKDEFEAGLVAPAKPQNRLRHFFGFNKTPGRIRLR